MPFVRRPLVAVFAAVTVAVVVLDQLTKAWALSRLTAGERVPVLGDLLGLELLFNPGAALGIATGMTWIFVVAALGVTVVVLRIAHRLGSLGWALALGLLLGGALGNLIDRLTRPPGFGQGHVVDFIAYGDLFVGNVADIAIVAAAGLVMLLTLRGIGLDGTRHGLGESVDGADGPD
ncbi:MAG TPA: signal peptidase II, partial [Actinotalea sp.]|nr:signal peptidase II [Actinotalea sp.]